MFVYRLDSIFYREHFDITNEPRFFISMLYNWAERPDHTTEVINELLENAFTDQRTGIPGNDDSGAMSSWFIFNSLGFYPNAGQDIYLIGTPSFPESEITLASGKTLRIIARNMDSEHINRFIQSATLNGAPLVTSWFRHKQIEKGGTLVFTMGSAPSKWGTNNPPPSMSDAEELFCKTKEVSPRAAFSTATRAATQRRFLTGWPSIRTKALSLSRATQFFGRFRQLISPIPWDSRLNSHP